MIKFPKTLTYRNRHFTGILLTDLIIALGVSMDLKIQSEKRLKADSFLRSLNLGPDEVAELYTILYTQKMI